MSVLALGAAAHGVVAMLAMMAVQGTVLALVALVIVRAGALRPAWQAAIWLVVLAKFVLPWGPAMPFSLSDLFALLRHEEAGAALALRPVASAAPAAAASLAAALGWIALASVWALGTVIVLTRAIAAQLDALRSARRATPAPAHEHAVLAQLAALLRVRAPRLAIGDPTTGPHVVGWLRPIIVVPPALLVDPPLLRAALLHELAHVRRRDALGRAVQVVASAVFVVWPIVRLAARRLDLAREAACDAIALEASGVSRPAYARLLVRMAALRTAAAPGLASPRTLDARVAAVLGPPAQARIGWAHRVLLVGWAVVALGGARTASARPSAEPCNYTPQLAEALRQAHPEADLDGDGVVSRDEACELDAEVRRALIARVDAPAAAPASAAPALLCCECSPGDGVQPPPRIPPSDASCQRVEGVDR